MRRPLVVALVLGGAGLVAWRWSTPEAASPYAGRIPAPVWTRDGPPVLIDNAHWNAGTSDGRLRAFAELLAADGYRVLPDANATRAETLADAGIAVVANPLGVPGVLRRWAWRAGIGSLAMFDDDALLQQEIETTAQWVENGGSLLLAVDPDPEARGSRGLAERLGVRPHGRVVVDLGNSEPGDPARLVFSRENDLFGTHPIVDGVAGAPQVNRVVAFEGQALEAPADGVVLLRLSSSAAEVERAGDPPTAGRPVGGLALAAALERGRGRVVVIGDTHLLTADAQPAGPPTGLAWPGTNNERFVRYVLRWLSRRDKT